MNNNGITILPMDYLIAAISNLKKTNDINEDVHLTECIFFSNELGKYFIENQIGAIITNRINSNCYKNYYDIFIEEEGASLELLPNELYDIFTNNDLMLKILIDCKEKELEQLKKKVKKR